MSRFTRRRFLGMAALGPMVSMRAMGGWSGHERGARRMDAAVAARRREREFTVLYTNDFHSAFEPIPAYWLPDSPRLGGAAHLATLIERERAAATTQFLFDSGDMFTGTMSFLTRGEALMEMMMVLDYDAMSVGNHEFDYGWEVFDHAITRVQFPVLCCNIHYRDSGRRFTRPHTIVERDGVRLGVIGVLGLRAAHNTIMPSRVAELAFTDPVAATADSVAMLRDSVDAIVVLAHQGLPAAMQTDAENDPEVQRPLDEDIEFCGRVEGIDLYIAAHSHHGLEEPILHPRTGTIITQTYGYGTRLGRVRLKTRDRRVVEHDVELLEVWSDELPPHQAVADRIAFYRRQVADEIGPTIGRANERIVRKYNRESPLGSLVTDVMRKAAGSDVAITNSGGLRADLPAGDLDRSHVLDALPFLNSNVTLKMSGADLRAAVEHGLSLYAGICQVSGIEARYDLRRPVGSRATELRVGSRLVADGDTYRVSTNSFLAEGGDGYAAFPRGREVGRGALLSELLQEHIRAAGVVRSPTLGRLIRI